MLREALTYPFRGERAEESLLVGSILAVAAGLLVQLGVLAVLAVVPVVLLAGYGLAVVRATAEGRTDPPAFADVRALAADGARALVVVVGYLAIPMVALAITFAGATSTGFAPVESASIESTLAESAPAESAPIESVPLESATVGTSLFVLVAGTVVLFGSLSFAYVLPAALAAVARTGSVGDAVALGRLRRSATDARYFVGWVTALSVAALSALLLGGLAALGRPGEVLALGVGFYAVVVVARVLGLSLAE